MKCGDEVHTTNRKHCTIMEKRTQDNNDDSDNMNGLCAPHGILIVLPDYIPARIHHIP